MHAGDLLRFYVEGKSALSTYDRLPDAVRSDSSPATLFQLFLLHNHHVATMDRRSFNALGSDGHHFLRISTANADEELAEAVRRIHVASKDADGFQRFIHSGARLTL